MTSGAHERGQPIEPILFLFNDSPMLAFEMMKIKGICQAGTAFLILVLQEGDVRDAKLAPAFTVFIINMF